MPIEGDWSHFLGTHLDWCPAVYVKTHLWNSSSSNPRDVTDVCRPWAEGEKCGALFVGLMTSLLSSQSLACLSLFKSMLHSRLKRPKGLFSHVLVGSCCMMGELGARSPLSAVSRLFHSEQIEVFDSCWGVTFVCVSFRKHLSRGGMCVWAQFQDFWRYVKALFCI